LFLVPPLSHALTGKVISIADGDTITILDSSKQQHKIHLYAIDRPEESQALGYEPSEIKEIPVEQVESTLPAPTEELSVEEQIREVAQENGFDDADLLVDIAFCESSLNPQATNGTSSATGLFQILDMHGLTVAERMDVATSTEWTISKIEKGGLNAWNASKHCWSA
jgi:hypothetical protein